MKYALIGKAITHSRSPMLYREFLGEDIQYDLIDISSEISLPDLAELSRTYQGINITSPYKKAFFSEVIVNDPETKELGAINTIAFTPRGWFGINTDLIAVEVTLKNFLVRCPHLFLIILGNGVMSKLTTIVARKLQLEYVVVDRQTGLNAQFNLVPFHRNHTQNLIINACSRDFHFSGQLAYESIFWDYNYDLIPHQNTLPSRVTMYLDGRDMLRLQAKAAAKFWLANID